MPSLPTSLALTSIADGSPIVAADHRNNYAAVQTEANALLTILGAGTLGDVFTGVGSTVAYAKPPGYEFAHNEITANVNPATTTEATATVVVTASAVTFDGATSVIVEFFSNRVQKGTNSISFALYDGAASIGLLGFQPGDGPLFLRRKITPSAAAHTYSIRAFVDAGTGTIVAGAGGLGVNVPAYIRITKV